jgi:hypothetical protein
MNRQLYKIRTATTILYYCIHMCEVRKFKVIKYMQVSVYFWVLRHRLQSAVAWSTTCLTYCELYVQYHCCITQTQNIIQKYTKCLLNLGLTLTNYMCYQVTVAQR